MPFIQYENLPPGKAYEIRVTSRLDQIDEIFHSVGKLENFLIGKPMPKDLKVVIFYSDDGGETYKYHHGVRLL